MEYYLIYLNEDGFVRHSYLDWHLDTNMHYYAYDDVNGGLSHCSKMIFDYPSTNGIYLVDGFVDEKRNHILRRFLVVTKDALNKILNDERINTMSANPKYFYRGKYVDSKTFIKKQLLVNEEYNEYWANVNEKARDLQ